MRIRFVVLVFLSGLLAVGVIRTASKVQNKELEQLDFRFPEFYQSHRYLLLLQFYPSGVASIAGGPVGVFTVDKNGKALPLTESEHRLRKDFQEKYGNSLDQLRKHLKSASW